MKLHAIFLFLYFDNPTFHSKDSYEKKNKEQGQANTLEPQPGATEHQKQLSFATACKTIGILGLGALEHKCISVLP